MEAICSDPEYGSELIGCDFSASDTGPDPDLSDNFGPPGNNNPSGVGDPINATTGNVYETVEDLEIPGKTLPLRLVRTYNSQDTIRGPLGYGWTHSYNASLKKNGDGSVTELAPDGKRLIFEQNADGSYSSPEGIEDRLAEMADGSHVLRKKGGYEWRFGQSGRLQEIVDPNASKLAFAHDVDGNLNRITDSAGRNTTLAYDTLGRIIKFTDPAGRSVRYEYEGKNLASVTDPAGNTTRYAYDAKHNLANIAEADGANTSFAYDAEDRAASTSGENGVYRMALDYRPAEDKTLVTDSKGNTSEFYYDQDEQVTRIVDPYGEEISYTWDANGNKSSETDQLGNTTRFEYDASGNLTKIVEPKPTASATANPTTILAYEPRFDRVESVTDPGEHVTRYAYDERGNLTGITDAEGNKTSLSYDASGQLVRTTNPRGNASVETGDGVTTFSYDAYGNLTAATDAAGEATRYIYGSAGSRQSVLSLPVTVTDPLGRTTDFVYDALGRTTRITNPLTPTDTVRTSVSVAYDASGDLTSYTDEKDDTYRATHDPYGRGTTSWTDPLGNSTKFSYDTEGNLVSMSDPAGNVARMKYDTLTRLTGVSRPDGTTDPDGTPGSVSESFGYDAAGRTTSYVDPKGQKTVYGYDAGGNLTSVSDLNASGAALQEAAYAYDLLGNMTRATNPNGNVTTYAYDKVDDLLKETDALGNTTSYVYDPNGNVKSRIDAMGRTTTYSYDPLDRPTGVSYPDATRNIRAAYDAIGNLIFVSDETGATTYTHDERNRLVGETLPGGRVLEYGYDATSNRTTFTYPDGKKALFSYDVADRLTSVTDRVGAKTTYAYNALDLPTRISYPTGAGDTYAYDSLGRVTQATTLGKNPAGAAVALFRLTYSYDKSSNPVSAINKAGKKSAYAYDILDRLVREAHPEQTLSYSYDPAGNRKSMTRDTPTTSPVTTSYAHDAAERMTRAGGTTFAYNKNRNMTGRTAEATTTGYTYDYEGMMTRAGTKTWERDPLGRAVSATVGTTRTDYLFDGAEVMQEKVGTAAPNYYTRGLDGQPINRRAGTTTPSYYHHDAVGSVVALSGNAGALTDAYSYTAFGVSRGGTGTNPQPFRYLGNANAGASLYDFHARVYEPGAGRFLSEDPVAGHAAYPQTLNPYAYGINNPLAQPDPYGEIVPLIAVGALVGAATGAGIYSLTAEEPTWRGAFAAGAGGVVVGGVGVMAVPAAGTLGLGTAGTIGMMGAGGVTGSVVTDGLDPDRKVNACGIATGAGTGLAGGLVGQSYKTVGMQTLKQAGYFSPRTLRGFVPKRLGGNAGRNANSALHKPAATDLVLGTGSGLLDRYYLSTKKACSSSE